MATRVIPVVQVCSLKNIGAALVVALAVNAASLQTACAEPALWPVSGLHSPSLSYCQEYVFRGKTFVHRGIDIPCEASSLVSSPVKGTVSFAGSVPSGDSAGLEKGASGSTMLAVSVSLEDGLTLTLMPFQDIAVSKGQEVEVGAALGTVAPGGDKSTASTHLHVGLKRGRTYLNPMMLFAAEPVREAQQQVQGEERAAEAMSAAISLEEPLVSEGVVGEGSSVQSAAYGPSQAASASAAQRGSELGHISSGGVDGLAAGQHQGKEEPGVLQEVGRAAKSFGAALQFQTRHLGDFLAKCAARFGVARGSLVMSVFLASMVLASISADAAHRLKRLNAKKLWRKKENACAREVANV